MLQRLEINNIALIDHLTVDFSEGMNCLTGETGAGKSIIIDSIGCILGNRTSRDLIRTGCNSAWVKGFFTLDSSEVRENICSVLSECDFNFTDSSLELYREFDKTGRNACKICGRSVSLAVLKTVGSFLVDVHGQHDNQSLLKVETHITLLDLFGGREIENLLEDYRAFRHSLSEKALEIRKLAGNPEERARKIDLLRYQANEITAAKLKIGEDASLSESHKLLANAEKISDALSSSYEALSGSRGSDGAVDLAGNAVSGLKKISDLSPSLSEIFTRTEEIYYNLQDLSSDLRRELDNVTFAPDELDRIDSRLDAINSLKRKYGSTIEDIIAFGKNAEETADKLEDCEEIIGAIEKEMAALKLKMLDLCDKLHTARFNVAEKLEKLISSELADLEMPGADFEVNICYEESDNPDFNSRGLDTVEFLMSANRGEPVKPLAKVASGGELSRIMLAIKKIFADVDKIPTLIFDEIDIGISGKTAASLGDKLRFIGGSHQVICVTHLAQIAARAKNNIIVRKDFNGQNTVTKVIVPDKRQRIEEIARLLDGNTQSELNLKHAEEMLNNLS